jgi:hypothetical protein
MERGIHGEVCVLWSFASGKGSVITPRSVGPVIPAINGFNKVGSLGRTHVTLYNTILSKKQNPVHPMHLSVSVTLVASSTTLQISRMLLQAVPRRRRDVSN